MQGRPIATKSIYCRLCCCILQLDIELPVHLLAEALHFQSSQDDSQETRMV